MKLKTDFVTQSIDDTTFLVPVGAEAFKGIVRSNPSAAFILTLLQEETTEEAIIDSMCEKYEASRETIAGDVREILETLRGIHALEE